MKKQIYKYKNIIIMNEYKDIESFNNNANDIYVYAINLLNNDNKEKCKEYLLNSIDLDLYHYDTIVKYGKLLEENSIDDAADFYLNLLKKIKQNGVKNINDLEKIKKANNYEMKEILENIDNRYKLITNLLFMEFTKLLDYISNNKEEKSYEFINLIKSL